VPAPGSRPTWLFNYRGVVRIPETPLRKLRAHLPTRLRSRSWAGAGVGRTPGPLRVSATREGRGPSQAPQAPPRAEGPSLRAGGAGSAGPVTVWEGVAARRSRRHAKRTTAGRDGVAAGRGPENRRLSLTRFRMHVRAQDGHDGNGRSEAPRGTVRGCGSEVASLAPEGVMLSPLSWGRGPWNQHLRPRRDLRVAATVSRITSLRGQVVAIAT
jgi:hypothetical protein